MSARSRTKGAAGEREVVVLAIEAGFPKARRGSPMQTAGGEALPDVDGIGGLWAEVKRHHHVQVPRLAAELLAVERPGYTSSVLFSRDDGGPWLATLDARELLNRHRELLDLRAEVARLRHDLTTRRAGGDGGAQEAPTGDFRPVATGRPL